MAAATSSAGRCGNSTVPKPVLVIFALFSVRMGAFAGCIFTSTTGGPGLTLFQRASLRKLAAPLYSSLTGYRVRHSHSALNSAVLVKKLFAVLFGLAVL